VLATDGVVDRMASIPDRSMNLPSDLIDPDLIDPDGVVNGMKAD
jgi:hypothetical protein